MSNKKSTYREIVKATSIFGGVQVFNIIISIFKSKAIAVLLGPGGMGIASLFTSTISLIGKATNFGLGISAVKDVAVATESGEEKNLARVIAVFRKLVWFTGLLGAVVCFGLSPWLSEFSFGNRDYTTGFMWLSISLFFAQLTSGQNVLLQGMRKLQFLAKANMIGALAGLLVSLPLYYFFGLDGIVPAIVISSIFALIISWYFARKVEIEKVHINAKETLKEGSEMMKMGFMLSLSGLITMGASYLIRIFISSQGGIDEVGLYNAGFAIIFSYVGLIFTAMATDYYPRLSGVAHDNEKASLLINYQAEIGLLILAPILCVFFVFINWIIVILYSTKFIPINEMIQWAALGMYFRMASWSIAFILLAKGNSKLFFWNELTANIYLLGLNVLGYYYWGLTGLGISFLVSYILYLLQIYFVAKYRYNFAFQIDFYKIYGLQLIIGILAFCTMKFIPGLYAFLIGSILILCSICHSYIELDRRLGVKEILNKFLKKSK